MAQEALENIVLQFVATLQQTFEEQWAARERGLTLSEKRTVAPSKTIAPPNKTGRGRPKGSKNKRNTVLSSLNGNHAPRPRTREDIEAMASAMVSRVSTSAPDGHDQWPLPEQEIIIVHGEQIWPTTDKRYDWRAAYYAFNLWRSLPVDAHRLRNPIGVLISHANGSMGVVIQKIADAMIECPNGAEKTRGPGKMLQGR